MSNGTSPTPGTRKVTVGALSGALVTVASFIAAEAGLPLTPEVTGAAATLVTALLVYMTRETYT